MVRLPAALERRLEALFPRVRERDAFVARAVEAALDDARPVQESLPESVGGSLHLYTDGGSRGNPGQAAIGCVLLDPVGDRIIAEHAERIGIETNNVAEYRALIAGLSLAQRYHPSALRCHLDSELVVKQVRGEYAVRMQSLQPLVEEIRSLAAEFSSIEFVHVPRARNRHADALVNTALDTHPAPPYERPVA